MSFFVRIKKNIKCIYETRHGNNILFIIPAHSTQHYQSLLFVTNTAI